MGTNYYWREKPCPTCKHSQNEIHIGKSSGGWTFSFYATFDTKSWKEWKLLFEKGNGAIFDEYGEEIQICHFVDMVDGKQSNPKNLNHAIEHPQGCFLDSEGYGFSEREFS